MVAKITYGSELVSVGASVSNEEILVITDIRTSASNIFRKIRYSMIKNAMVIMIFVLLSHRLRGRSTIKYLVTIVYRFKNKTFQRSITNWFVLMTRWSYIQ